MTYFTVTMIHDCLQNLDLEVDLEGPYTIRVGGKIDVTVYSNHVKLFNVGGPFLLSINDIFDLQDWMIEHFK